MEQNIKLHDETMSAGGPDGHPSDQVDLVKLWLILCKRKYLIGGVTFVCLLGGLAFAFLAPINYSYSTIIDIGTTIANGAAGLESRAIASPVEVQAKLESSYIPLAVEQMAESNGDGFWEIKATTPRESRLVILTSKGTADMAESYRLLHSLATKPLIEDHIRIVDVPRREYQLLAAQEEIKLKALEDPRTFAIEEEKLLIDIEAAKAQLVKLDDQKKLLLSQEKRLSDTQILLRQQIKQVEENLAQAYANRPKATAEVDNEVRAMTMLMITNQIVENENRLSDLKERLTITLEDQKDVLQKEVAENRRSFDLQKAEISKLQGELVKFKVQRETDQLIQTNVVLSIQNKIDDLHETHTMGAATRSYRPIGVGKISVLALSGILGFALGVFLAFFTEFVSTVRVGMASGCE